MLILIAIDLVCCESCGSDFQEETRNQRTHAHFEKKNRKKTHTHTHTFQRAFYWSKIMLLIFQKLLKCFAFPSFTRGLFRNMLKWIESCSTIIFNRVINQYASVCLSDFDILTHFCSKHANICFSTAKRSAPESTMINSFSISFNRTRNAIEIRQLDRNPLDW